MPGRELFLLVLAGIWFTPGGITPSVAQEADPPELADLILDASDEIIVFNDLEMVVDDVTKMGRDLGFDFLGDAARDYINPRPDSGIARPSPAASGATSKRPPPTFRNSCTG